MSSMATRDIYNRELALGDGTEGLAGCPIVSSGVVRAFAVLAGLMDVLGHIA